MAVSPELVDVSPGTVEKDRDNGEMICGQEPVHISRWMCRCVHTLLQVPRDHRTRLASDRLMVQGSSRSIHSELLESFESSRVLPKMVSKST